MAGLRRFDRGVFWILRSCGLGLGGWRGAGSWPVRMLSEREGVDDDHRPAAGRAELWCGCVVVLVLLFDDNCAHPGMMAAEAIVTAGAR